MMGNHLHPPNLNLVHVLESGMEKVGEEFENFSKTLLGNLEATLTAGEGEKCVSGLPGREHFCNRWAY